MSMNKLNTLKRNLLICFTFLIGPMAVAQIPQVPNELRFADLTIRINEQARREIQSDVDALYRSPTYFRAKAERVNLYLPLVERELRDAGVPIDFKYLVIQESSLIPDAVSTSNAVGFWQFKQGTAEEVSLRVDSQVDDRKNIVTSTQGAARYLKKNNAQFDNWMCALVAYQMGLGGARGYFGTQFNGKKVIEIDRNSHWYFKKFLAHKVAFESPTVMLASNSGFLEEIRIQGPTTLKAIAPRIGVTEAHLKEYNKWSAKGNIPDDRPYSIVYMREGTQARPAIAQTQPTPQPAVSTVSNTAYPKVTGNQSNATQPNQIKVNNIEGVKAANTTTQEKFTDQIGINENKFRRINDLEKDEKVEAGQYYYTKAKKTRAEEEQHVVLPGETLWSISQMYGIKLSALKAKNRIKEDRDLKAGMMLNLREHIKRGEDIPMVPASEFRKVVAYNNQQQPTSASPTTVSSSQTATIMVSNPTQSTTSPKVTIHTVVQGENLFRIGQKYGVTVDDIKKWNRLSNNEIKIGQKLTINKP